MLRTALIAAVALLTGAALTGAVLAVVGGDHASPTASPDPTPHVIIPTQVIVILEIDVTDEVRKLKVSRLQVG